VPRALITHAHGDHLVPGCEKYLLASIGAGVARERLADSAAGVEVIEYGHERDIHGVRVSFQPAGHILGSSQIRLEHRGEVWVVSGDYKVDPDPTCAPWEPIRCNTFITESTFGLPIYRWPSQQSIWDDINTWWRQNADAGITSLLYGYALGKAQRLIAGLDPSIGPILTHGAVERMTQCYRRAGVTLPDTTYATGATKQPSWSRAIVVAPPSADSSTWTRRFGDSRSAFASGWMRVRGNRRRRGFDRGFVLSDHVDWPGLLRTIEETGARRVLATHGYGDTLARYLREVGLAAEPLLTQFECEVDGAE
jgi:putative mRNA 3-end processing factor